MARSLLQSFVSGTRQVLTVQLIVSVGAIALSGWTLGVTNELIRERDRLRERVIQLEQTMGGSGIVVPDAPVVVDQATPPPSETVYPGAIGDPPAPETPQDDASKPDGAAPAPETPVVTPEPAPEPAPTADETARNNLGALIGSLFSPPPAMRLVVLHVRGENDAAEAQRIARELQAQGNVQVTIDVMGPRDARESGYAYFDGRQGRAAAGLVTQFHDIARRQEVAAWSAQLRGVALPAQGEYTADRLDLVLPPLPEQPALQLQRIDPRVIRAPQRVN